MYYKGLIRTALFLREGFAAARHWPRHLSVMTSHPTGCKRAAGWEFIYVAKPSMAARHSVDVSTVQTKTDLSLSLPLTLNVLSCQYLHLPIYDKATITGEIVKLSILFASMIFISIFA